MDYNEAAMRMHREHRGKIEIAPKVAVRDRDALSTAYTPGVAEPCREIARDPAAVWELTARGNFVAVVSDGSAVLGLGNIGALAALPCSSRSLAAWTPCPSASTCTRALR